LLAILLGGNECYVWQRSADSTTVSPHTVSTATSVMCPCL